MNPIRAARRYIGRSLRRQLVIGVVVVHAVLMSVFVVDLVSRQAATLDKARQERAQGVAQMLAASSDAWVLSQDVSGLEELVKSASGMPGLRYAMILTPDGRVLAHTDRKYNNLYPSDLVGRSLRSGAATPRVLAKTSAALDVAAPIRMNDRHIGWAWVSVSRSEVTAAIGAAIRDGCLYLLIAVLSGWLLAYLMGRNIAGGLRHLAEVSERFRAGDRTVRVVQPRHDELGAVGRGVNAMLDTIGESENSLQMAWRIAKIGAWRCDLEEGRLHWSEEVHALFGLDPSAPPPSLEAFVAMLPDESRAIVAAVLDRDNPKETFAFHMPVMRPDGTQRICFAEGRSELDADGRLIRLIGICQDVTERESAAEQLRQAQKMEAVGQLTGGLAHDFNNLLAVIIGNLDLLDGELDENSEGREFNATALEAALKGAELTRQLLAFSRRQPLSPRTISPNELLTQMNGIWSRTLGANVVVRVQTAPDLWPAQADPSQLDAALLNLVINARDAMDGRGVLTIETGNVHLDQVYADENPDVVPGEYAMISVSDTGHGISAEVLGKVFEPFFTTKSVGKGSGLGLSMVYGFAKQSGGHVKIYSEVGHGTTVRLFLPRAGAVGPTDAAPAPVALPRSQGEMVLVVEDNEDVRRVAVRQLKDLGYGVLEAENGEAALALLDGEPGIALLFTDIVMPGGMTGIELVSVARQRRPDLRALYTTGFTQAAAANGGKFTGSDLLVSKPYRAPELAAKVREVLDA